MSVRTILRKVFGAKAEKPPEPSALSNAMADLFAPPKPPAISEPLVFQGRPGSAFDPITGLTIPEPRIIIGYLPDGTRMVEHHYVFYRKGQVIKRIGLYGRDVPTQEVNGWVRVYSLNFGHAWIISSMLELKQTLGYTCDDYTFVCSLAKGMLQVYEAQTDNHDNLRYMAVALPGEMVRGGVELPTEKIPAFRNHVLLADYRILKQVEPVEPPPGTPAAAAAGAINEEQMAAIDAYLASPGSGVDAESSFAQYLEQLVGEHSVRLPADKSYVFYWGIDEECVVNYHQAARYAVAVGGGLMGDSDLGRFIDDLMVNLDKHPEFDRMARGIKAFMDAQGTVPLNNRHHTALQERIWTVARVRFMDEAIRAGKPIRAFVNEPEVGH